MTIMECLRRPMITFKRMLSVHTSLKTGCHIPHKPIPKANSLPPITRGYLEGLFGDAEVTITIHDGYYITATKGKEFILSVYTHPISYLVVYNDGDQYVPAEVPNFIELDTTLRKIVNTWLEDQSI